MNTSSLFNLSWPRYLNLLFLLLSAGFLTSGIVTLIAANLDYFSDLAKNFMDYKPYYYFLLHWAFTFFCAKAVNWKRKIKTTVCHFLFYHLCSYRRCFCFSGTNLSNGG